MMSRGTLGSLVCHVACGAVGALCVPAGAQSIPIDDFNDGVADGWDHVPWPYHDPNFPFFFDAGSGAYHLGTSVSVPTDSAEALISAWLRSYGDDAPLYSEGFLRARVRALNAGTDVAIAMRAADPNCAGSAYVFFARPAGELGILSVPDCNGFGVWIENPGGENPAPVNYEPDGEWWWLEAGAIGNELSLRVWRVGAPEPPAPQLVVHDPNSTFVRGGFTVGVVHQSDYPPLPLAGEFDDLTFRPACPGDLDLDRAVGLADLAVLLANFGTLSGATYRDGDLNGEGVVSLPDLALLLATFGNTCLGPSP